MIHHLFSGRGVILLIAVFMLMTACRPVGIADPPGGIEAPKAPTSMPRPASPELSPSPPRVVTTLPQPTSTPSPLPPPSTSPSPSAGVPAKAPDFRLISLEGKEVALSDWRGKVVLLNFWTTWCPYCRRERTALQAAYETYGDQGFVVVAVDIGEGREKVESYAKELGLTFPMLLDSMGTVASLYSVRGIPASFFIDREGVLRAQHIGSLDENAIDSYLRKLL